MLRLTRFAILAAAILCAAITAYAGSMSTPAGYTCVDTPVNVVANVYFGGFDILPNGNFAVHDGYAIREITPAGAHVDDLYTYTYSARVYGSFVKYNSANGRVYFGDSSAGKSKMYSMATDGTDLRLIGSLNFNFDLDFYDGNAFVVASNKVYQLNESDGSLDTILTVGEASGPLAFDASGNLYYGVGEPGWPPARNNQNIYKWSAAEVADAIGPGELTPNAAHVFAENVDGPYGFAFDGAGNLMYTDTVADPGVVRVFKNGEDQLYSTSLLAGADPTTIRYNPANGSISVAVTWFDEYWNRYAIISTMAPVPEPSSLAAFCSLIGLAASAKLLRRK